MKYHILIVDDESIVRKGLEGYGWEALGFEVAYSCKNGREALAWLENNPVEAILTDIRMPGIDGLELCRIVHERYPDILVVLLSGYDEFKYARQGIQYGVFDYLLKPAEETEIDAVFRKAYEKISASREREKALANLARNTWLLKQMYDLSETPKPEPFELPRSRPDCRSFVVVRVRESNGGLPADPLWLQWADRCGFIAVRAAEWAGLVPSADLEKLWEEFAAFRLHAGCSRVQSGEEAISSAFAEAGAALEQRFFFPDRQVFAYAPPSVPYLHLLKSTLKFIRTLHGLQPAALHTEIDQFLDRLAESNVSEEQCKQLLLSVLSGLERALSEKALFPFEEWFGKQPDLYRMVERSACMAEIRDRVIPEIRRMTEEVRRMNSEHCEAGKLADVLEYIHARYQEQLSLDTIADRFGMHATIFSRWFKEQKGVNYLEYVIRLRIKKAGELLEDTDLKIGEIAERTGYIDARYFGQVFKKMTGFTPSEYRAMLHSP